MLFWPTLLTGVLGGTASSLVVAFSLSRWLGDVWRDRIIERLKQENSKEIERLKAEYATELAKLQGVLDRANLILNAGIERSTLVTRTHFETEFTAYRSIFAALSEVRRCIFGLRPQLQLIPHDEAPQQTSERRRTLLNGLITAQNNAVMLKDDLSPFYTLEIYEAVDACVAIAAHEVIESTRREDFVEESPHEQAFVQRYNAVAGLIRERLASLGVLPQ